MPSSWHANPVITPSFRTAPEKPRILLSRTSLWQRPPGKSKRARQAAPTALPNTISCYVSRKSSAPWRASTRSEERRVGKECRARGAQDQYKRKKTQSQEREETTQL